MLVDVKAQKASTLRLSQPKHESPYKRFGGKARWRGTGSAPRVRPTSASIINASAQEAVHFFNARRIDREKRMAAIGGFGPPPDRPDSARVRKRMRLRIKKARSSRETKQETSQPVAKNGTKQIHPLNAFPVIISMLTRIGLNMIILYNTHIPSSYMLSFQHSTFCPHEK